MTRDDVIRMAREAGFKRTRSCCGIDDKFCSTDEWRGDIVGLIMLVYRAGMVAEREACIEDVRTVGGEFAVECEALIMARGEMEEEE